MSMSIEERVTRLEAIIEQINARLDSIDQRLDGLESRMTAGFHSINGHIITAVVGLAGIMVAGFITLGVGLFLTR